MEPSTTSSRARRLRAEPAYTETLLWKLLRNRRLYALKFRRQMPIGPYIADFVCLRHRLVIEADGPLHDPERDARRDEWLRGQHFRVLRFSNDLIARHPDEVLDRIAEAAGVARPLIRPLRGHLLPQGEKDI
jgi:very-short-patch-repair endonuclease